jgi:hypothetical protein
MGPVGVGGILPVVLAQPMWNEWTLSLELRRGAAEARPGGPAVSNRFSLVGQVRAFRCAVVPRRFFRVAPACRVLGLEARHHSC